MSVVIMGCDPGADAGLAMVRFDLDPYARNPLPHWNRAKLLCAFTIAKPEREGATAAELDILHRNRIATRVTEHTQTSGFPNIIALEEPLDGGGSWKGAQGQKGQRRETAFRLGVHYAALLHGVERACEARANWIISYPVQTTRARRGWMAGRRDNALAGARMTLQLIATLDQLAELRTKRGELAAEHILMAIAVINHTVEYFTEYFPEGLKR